MNFELGLGIIGMTLILVAFVLDEFKKIRTDSVQYNLINIIGSGLLLYYAYTLQSIPFLVLNGIWFLVAGYKIVRIILKS